MDQSKTFVITRYDRYNHSQKGDERDRRYRHSEKGVARAKRFYDRYGGKKKYEMDAYYRIQDEAGFHAPTRIFYPGFRFIKALKALENAEIVEI